MRRKHLLLLLILPVLLCSSGCSSSSSIWANYRQIEQLKLVQTLGIDAESNGVRLSFSTGKSWGTFGILIPKRPCACRRPLPRCSSP